MAKKNELDFHLPSADDLFSTQEEREDAKLKRIYEISLDEIDPFPKHPFKVKEDENMKTLVDSIKEFGVLTPATVRRKEDGRYELLSGHRRKRACELAGLDTLRCEVVELDKDAATIFMVDSNLQRTTILPSEKAFSYKMRLVKEPALYSAEPIKTPDDVLRVIADELKSYDREVFAIINLKSSGQIINLNVCSIGTLNDSLVSPREIMKAAILSNASAFIAVHNHPSGNCSPSSEDIETTKRLVECGEILDIRMLDHIIVAGETGKMLSMKAEGSMPDIRKKDWER